LQFENKIVADCFWSFCGVNQWLDFGFLTSMAWIKILFEILFFNLPSKLVVVQHIAI
jgi:hypothetical protein